MKSLLKFSLLSALVIGGKLTKPAAPVAVAQTVKADAPSDSSLVLVHQLVPAAHAKPARHQSQPQASGSGLIAELF